MPQIYILHLTLLNLTVLNFSEFFVFFRTGIHKLTVVFVSGVEGSKGTGFSLRLVPYLDAAAGGRNISRAEYLKEWDDSELSIFSLHSTGTCT